MKCQKEKTSGEFAKLPDVCSRKGGVGTIAARLPTGRISIGVETCASIAGGNEEGI